MISDNLGNGSGNNLLISVRRLDIQNGGEITTRAFGAGISGSINVNVLGLMTLDGWSSFNPTLASLIGVKALGSARGASTSAQLPTPKPAIVEATAFKRDTKTVELIATPETTLSPLSAQNICTEAIVP